MAGALVHYDPGHEERLVVEGHGILWFEDPDRFSGPMDVAMPASLTSLRRALLKWLRDTDGTGDEIVRVELAHATPRQYREDSPVDVVSLVLRAEQLLVDVFAPVRRIPREAAVRRLLSPLLARQGALVVALRARRKTDAYHGGLYLQVTLSWPTRRRTVGDAWSFGHDVASLVGASDGGEFAPSIALDLVRAGRWDLLRGQPENDWLDAKSRPYDTANPVWRFELAKDVAAFANRSGGGFIVIGFTTKATPHGEIITGQREFELHDVSAQTYRNSVARYVYPRVEGFAVEHVEGPTKGRGIVLLIVPAQSDSSRPFLVHGVVRQGDVLGAHVLIPVRREDQTGLLDVGGIHVRLRLGEQAIRGEGPPAPEPEEGPGSVHHT